MFAKETRLNLATELLLYAAALVGVAWVCSAFLQISFVAVVPPETTWFLRFDAGTVHLEYWGGPVWLSWGIVCKQTFQTFHWLEFYYFKIPVDSSGIQFPRSEVLFPIWFLLVPLFGGALLTVRRSDHAIRRASSGVCAAGGSR